MSSASTRSTHSSDPPQSLSSSEESNEEEDDVELPTPSSVDAVGFTDPWAKAYASKRPGLETVDSGETERGEEQ